MNYLDRIIMNKRKEVEFLKNSKLKRFSSALRQSRLAVIGEIKRRSPSKGKIGEIADPAALALTYCQAGASAVSVLTDSAFGGTLDDLQQVAKALEEYRVPVLRKDFIIHPLQLVESVLAGASAVLLIARLLGGQLKDFIEDAAKVGLETLTEVHDLQDLELALEAKAPIIGVNHRNLETFEIDLSLSETLRPHIPSHVIAVAESGIHSAVEAKRMRELGYDAILVGEALVHAGNCPALITAMQGAFYEN